MASLGAVPAWMNNKDDLGPGAKEPGEKDWLVEGEVTSRRQRKVSKEDVQKAKDEHVSLDWDDIFPKKPMDRLRWLDKALRAAEDGRIKASPLFNIIAHRKFVEGLKGQVATDCLNLIRGSLSIFTPKQQKQLTSENFELFRKYAPISVLDSDDDEADAPPLPPPPKVIVEPKDKKKREKMQQQRLREESDDGDSQDDTETKRRKILSKGVERRVDPDDGQAYTLPEFIEQYGGNTDRPPVEWDNASHSAFIFKE